MSGHRGDDLDKYRGLYDKFIVRRLDEAAQARHDDCEHFVLDLTHDEFAAAAIEAYEKVADLHGYTKLAEDLRMRRAQRKLVRGSAGGGGGTVTSVAGDAVIGAEPLTSAEARVESERVAVLAAQYCEAHDGLAEDYAARHAERIAASWLLYAQLREREPMPMVSDEIREPV